MCLLLGVVKKFSSGDGFGFTRNKKGYLARNKHNFKVVIGKNVEIGRNTNIDKGSYRDTIIGDGTKIDSLVHIGHNSIIGKHCLIVSGVVIGGSSEIGDFSYVGMNASIRQHTRIGKHCIIGAGSVVINHIPSYSTVAGNPAKPVRSSLTKDERFKMVGY